jgi:lactate dehydrogenase-like 2-hydroxyacid dehydrogenase
MKKTALLINTARGAIIDEAALAEALLEGSIAGAGLDVYSDEPPAPRDPLRSCKNVVLTPHTAGQTREAMDRMVTCMLDNLDRVARGVEPRYRVV